MGGARTCAAPLASGPAMERSSRPEERELSEASTLSERLESRHELFKEPPPLLKEPPPLLKEPPPLVKEEPSGGAPARGEERGAAATLGRPEAGCCGHGEERGAAAKRRADGGVN